MDRLLNKRRDKELAWQGVLWERTTQGRQQTENAVVVEGATRKAAVSDRGETRRDAILSSSIAEVEYCFERDRAQCREGNQ